MMKMKEKKGGVCNPYDIRYERHVMIAWGDVRDMLDGRDMFDGMGMPDGRLEMSPIETLALNCFDITFTPVMDDMVDGDVFIAVLERFSMPPVYVKNVIVNENQVVLRLAVALDEANLGGGDDP